MTGALAITWARGGGKLNLAVTVGTPSGSRVHLLSTDRLGRTGAEFLPGIAGPRTVSFQYLLDHVNASDKLVWRP